MYENIKRYKYTIGVINENMKSERDETLIFLLKEINILSWLKYYYTKTFSN